MSDRARLESGRGYEALSSLAPNSTDNSFRARRFSQFLKLVDGVLAHKGSCHVLDLGGMVEYWDAKTEILGARKVKITIVNVVAQNSSSANIESVSGDARNLPQFQDDSFDIVHSNSVIEHVGLWKDMQAMAHEVRRLAPSYFVQTPNYWFPIEPHFRAPLIHWLPDSMRLSLMMRRRDYPNGKATVDAAMHRLHSTILLDRKMMAEAFPDATLVPEKFFGLTKSWMAIRA